MVRTSALLLTAAALVAISTVTAGQTPAPLLTQPQTPLPSQPAFRTRTTLVPVDVRVVDASGKPVTDLTERDFEILENGVPQRIQSFAVQTFGAEPHVVAASAGVPAGGLKPIAPQSRRIFLIVLGRGRLQPPARGVDGMIHFVRDRLLPNDIVAVMAWNRATAFTTDHAKITAFLERFKTQHVNIENALAMYFAGLTAIYGPREIPKGIQKDIDALFGDPVALGTRTVTPGTLDQSDRIASDERRQIDALQRAEILATRQPGEFLPETVDEADLFGLGMSLDEMASTQAQSSQDLEKITAGIRYLRYLDGEKHLIFVSPGGVMLPRRDDDLGLAAQAANARIAISIVHTGGVSPNGGINWQAMTSQTVAEETGGTYSGLWYASKFADRLDDATRLQYLIGYSPANPSLDGRFRHIVVRVKRRGLTVLYRHGYYARESIEPLDRSRIVTYSRVSSAASAPQEIHDIALSATAQMTQPSKGQYLVTLQVHVAPERLQFSDAGDRKKGSLEIAYFVADAREQLVGQGWNTAALEMTPPAFAIFQAKGLSMNVKASVRAPARWVKVVVYDPGADAIGSVILRVK